MHRTHNSAKVGSIPSTCTRTENHLSTLTSPSQTLIILRSTFRKMTLTEKFKKDIQTLSGASNGDFYIDHSDHAPGVIHALIGSPGLTAAPAIAELMIEKLADAGMVVEEKKGFIKRRTAWPRFATASSAEREHMISLNPKYGHIVCRCELVTEGEIIEAIGRGADTMDAVKHVTRAGMGRCQGGFCGPHVLNCISTEQGISPVRVNKMKEGSHQITKFTCM